MINKQIFTFWEPKNNIHDYLKLCIKSWSKYLSDYEVVVLDYQSIYKYLDKEEINLDALKYFSLPKQADFIRCLLLWKWGGVWLDTDTVIISEKFRNIIENSLENSECTFVESSQKYNMYNGLIIARKNSFVLEEYIKEANLRIKNYGKPKNKLILNKIFKNKEYKAYKDCHFLGSAILSKIVEKCDTIKYNPLNNAEVAILPEKIYYPDIKSREAYVKFYFEDNHQKDILQDKSSVLCLHNSWTPDKYKSMTEAEFLKQNITLANIFK